MSLQSYSKTILLAVSLLLWLPFSLSAEQRTGNQLEVRLLTHLTSYSSPVGTPFECVVIRTLHPAGHEAIPRGSLVFGSVRKQQSVGLGLRHERAALELNFDRYQRPDGQVFPLTAQLDSIDNAGEEVTPKGLIKGVLAANNPGNLLNGFWSRPLSGGFFLRSLVGLTGAANQVWVKYSMGPVGAAGLYAVRCIIIPFPEPEIHFAPGTDLKLSVSLPVAPASPSEELKNDELKEGAMLTQISWQAQQAAVRKSAMMADLSDWLKDRAGQITFANGKPASDVFNVVLFGSRRELILAFESSDWVQADRRTLGASSRMYRAFSSKRSYAAAPVSPLLCRGLPPDLIFEKSLDTITQRHHVRFWRAGDFEGREVWLGAATHDTGIKFRLASMSFTHKIEPDVDIEREKISTDLSFAGCSGEADLLNQPAGTRRSGDTKVVTDGRMAVLAAQPCLAGIASGGDAPRPPGNTMSRFTRRMVLETRNYILRDNAYYWSYRMIRSSWRPTASLLH